MKKKEAFLQKQTAEKDSTIKAGMSADISDSFLFETHNKKDFSSNEMKNLFADNQN